MARCARSFGCSHREVLAWDIYHEHWFQLDVPRHDYIHSVASLTRVATEAGFMLEGVEFDSSAHQFAVSEGFKLGLTVQAAIDHFPAQRMREWARLTREVHSAGRGNQAIFYFRA